MRGPMAGQGAGYELADPPRRQMPVLVAREQPADRGIRSNPIGDRRGQVVADRHRTQLAALAVNQKRRAGRSAREVAAMDARYLGPP